MSNRLYDFNLAGTPNATQRVDVRGTVLRLVSSSAGYVGVKLDTGAEVLLLPGQGFRMPPGKEFRDVTLRNVGGLANTGSIFIGDLTFDDARITGDVTVIDNGSNKTAAGKQFLCSVKTDANVSTIAVSGIFANGKQVSVKKMTLASNTAGAALVLIGNNIGTATPASGAARNKLLGSTNSVANVTTGYTAAALPTAGELPGQQTWFVLYMPAYQPVEVPLTTPILLQGTQVLAASGFTVNRDMVAVFDIEELS